MPPPESTSPAARSLSVVPGEYFCTQLGGGMKGFRVGRKPSIANVRAILRDGARNLVREIRVPSRKLRRVVKRQAHEIVEHEHLAVAIRTGTDANRGDVQLFGDISGELARDGF